MCFKKIKKKASSVFQRVFNEVLFSNFDLAWISSQLPEQKEGLFFLMDNNGQTQIYRLVSGQPEVRFQRNRDLPAKLIRVKKNKTL